MKLDAKSGPEPSTSKMGEVQVTLRRLDASVLGAPAELPPDPADLAGLVETQPQPYLIGPQDVLLVTVWDHPEITLALGQYRTDTASGSLVDENGNIFFPYVGQIHMSGMTTAQARVRLTAELAKVLKNPQVDLKVIAFRSQKVFVGGEVKNPAVYTVTDVPFTLEEAVNRAGGFSPIADDSRLVLTRGGHSWTLNFHALMTRTDLAGKILLKDGDSLLVSSNLENPVYLMGEVVKPGTLPLIHGNITLAKAISDAGGVAATSSDASSIYVIRRGDASDRVNVFHLDGRNPTAMVLADQFALRPRDIVYVDAGSTVRFSRVMTLVLPTVTAVTSAITATADYRVIQRNY